MSDLKRQFDLKGYVVIPGLLSRAEADHYRSEIQKLSGMGDADYGSKVFECPDGISKNRAFWPLIYHPRLLEAVRAILGPTVRYTQHSDLHVHRGGGAISPSSVGGWHRDSACRKFGVGPDWDPALGPYQIARVAIYLQSFTESGSSLGVIPGSHAYERLLTADRRLVSRIDRRIWKPLLDLAYRARRALWKAGLGPEPLYYHPYMHMRTSTSGPPLVTPPALPVWIRTEPGDCVIFNQRLFHIASPIRGPKYAMFLSYAPEDRHARNHLSYYRHTRKDLGYAPLDSELANALRERELFLDAPEPSGEEGQEGFVIPEYVQRQT